MNTKRTEHTSVMREGDIKKTFAKKLHQHKKRKTHLEHHRSFFLESDKSPRYMISLNLFPFFRTDEK